MQFETLKYEVKDGVARLTINRPDSLNALNRQVHEELIEVAKLASNDESIDVLVLGGEGRAFVAGADIKAMLEYSPEEAKQFSELGHQAMDAIAALPFPTIAAIHGFALGGGLELALTCDLLYASDKAVLGLPEVALSVIPGWGGTQRLGRRIGWHHARELIFTGRKIKAAQAKEIGLVLDVYPIDEFASKIDERVAEIRANGPLALRAAKSAIFKGEAVNLEQAMVFEQEAFGALFGTHDQVEGMTALLERRSPEFERK